MTMAIGEWVDALLFFVSQWLGVTLPRIAAALLGLLIVVLVIMGLWERRIRAMSGILLGIAGLSLLAIAIDTRILHAAVASSFLSRIRFGLALLSLVVLGVTFESIRVARLRERYALLWLVTAVTVLLVAVFPQTIDFITVLLGVQYVTAIVGVVFTFLLLVVFHFSVALSSLEEDRARIAQRCALVERRVEELEHHLNLRRPVPAEMPMARLIAPASPGSSNRQGRRFNGAIAASVVVIVVSFLAVLLVGLKTREPLIGDEVTHFFMLTRQAEVWPTPAFQAWIPNGWSDEPEVRNYPHPNGWHYIGGWLYRMMPSYGFVVIQFYQALFWLQLLVVMLFWSRARSGGESRASLLLIAVLASIPMNLLFSVAFYQDVPMAAQAVTAFYLLDRRRYLSATLFLLLALWIKVTGVIFAVPFVMVCVYHAVDGVRKNGFRRFPWARLVVLMALIGTGLWTQGWMLKTYANAPYYPVQQIERSLKQLRAARPDPARDIVPPERLTPAEHPERPSKLTVREAEIIANHPGDLRLPINFILYGGVLLWLVCSAGAVGLLRPRSHRIPVAASRRRAWPLFVGFFYLAVAYMQLRTAPDARFFLPALPFVLLPLCEWAMRLPKSKWILIVAVVIAFLQGTYTLNKTAKLRRVDDALIEAIRFLEKHPPTPLRIFMYPEGNYRLFPAPSEWYLGYRLREFWWGDNDYRIELLRRRRVGAVVVKKHLIQPVDAAITNLGIYPPEFVRDLKSDPRFEKWFENEAVYIFGVR